MQKVKAAARGKKKFRDKSDRETRLSEALEGSADAEEALLNRATESLVCPSHLKLYLFLARAGAINCGS